MTEQKKVMQVSYRNRKGDLLEQKMTIAEYKCFLCYIRWEGYTDVKLTDLE